MQSNGYDGREKPEYLGFPARLETIIGRDSLREFGHKCGLSEGTLRKYLKGDTFPTLDRLDAIANAGNVAPEWLLTGRDAIKEPGAAYKIRVRIDAQMLQNIIMLVEQGAEARNIELAGDKKANIIALTYQYYEGRNEPTEMETILQFIDLAK